MGIPANPIEQCIVCGAEERHIQIKRSDGWTHAHIGENGAYVLICPDCSLPGKPVAYLDLDEDDAFEAVALVGVDDEGNELVATHADDPGRYVLVRQEGDRA